MGSNSFHAAQSRVHTALEQRVTAADSPAEREEVYKAFIGELVEGAMDEKTLDGITRALADDPNAIEGLDEW